MWKTAILALGMLLAAALPSFWPATFPSLEGLKVDTDPENMLSPDTPVRVFHTEMKAAFGLHDMLVVGVESGHPDGVFNVATLGRVHAVARAAERMVWEGPDGAPHGVVAADMLSPPTVETVEQAGAGAVRFLWLMPEPPATAEEALAVRERALAVPLLAGTLVSDDGQMLALYLPLRHKKDAHRVAAGVEEAIAAAGGEDTWHLTGLPVAEETFGVEMFRQMGISAPLAMVVIFLLLLLFFKRAALVLSPMLVAMATVFVTMGLLVVAGQTVHIMSSMIPIFLMPIAVLDSVHILSELFDRHTAGASRRETVREVMQTLWTPMLFTSITTAVGFGSLALTPIPPVRVFGVFVALGVLVAWLLTVTFVPAWFLLLPKRAVAGFGAGEGEPGARGFLAHLGRFATGRAGLVLALGVVGAAVAVVGVMRIRINDNPVKWFEPSHPIRVADRALNRHFAGTYMAFLALAPAADPGTLPAARAALANWGAVGGAEAVAANALEEAAAGLAAGGASGAEALASLEEVAADASWEAETNEEMDAWEGALEVLGEVRLQEEVFKRPDVLRWVGGLQNALLATGVVGKSSSLTDLVKTVHRSLLGERDEEFRVPDTTLAVGQVIASFQNSHRPNDLWHFVTPNYRRASLWVQLKSGDNLDMAAVAAAAAAHLEAFPPPEALTAEWFGLTWINVVWQERMVAGMLGALLGSFLVVYLLMSLLFRSPLWGLLAMLPLTLTIGLIYGVIGLVGKDYDMPVAVLSSLTLGLAVDFAIHLLARSRALVAQHGSWAAAKGHLFGEPARAVWRNVAVLGVGFLPLLFSPLLPYRTVGALLAAILVISGLATLLLLPAIIELFSRRLFPGGGK